MVLPVRQNCNCSIAAPFFRLSIFSSGCATTSAPSLRDLSLLPAFRASRRNGLTSTPPHLLEIDLALQDVPELRLGSGVTTTDLGLRLRYEIRRNLVPTIGISWQKSYGGTAVYLQSAGKDDDSFAVLAGIRL